MNARSRLDLLAKWAAIGLALVYGTGFVIVSLSEARYGISAFDVLKPRAFGAGITFLGLTMVTSFVALRTFGLAWWTPKDLTEERKSQRTQEVFVMMPFFYWLCVTFSRQTPFLFEHDHSSGAIRPWQWYDIVGLGTLMVMIVFSFVRGTAAFRRHPNVCAGTAVALMAVYGAASLRSPDMTFNFWISAWLFGVGALVALWHNVSLENLRNQQWEQLLAMPLGAIGLYAILVYPHINNAWGGGVPAQVSFYFKDSSPVGSPSLDTNLIDENDHGFYVTNDRKSRISYFIPRDAVKAIKFETRESEIGF